MLQGLALNAMDRAGVAQADGEVFDAPKALNVLVDGRDRQASPGCRERFKAGPKTGKGLTAVTTLSKRWAIVEAKAAAISTLGVADTFTA